MSGAAGAGVLAAAVGGGLRSRHAGAGEGSRPAALREVRLEARELSWELAPGKVVKAMAYNGQIPGPEIRLKEGERVRIVLQNRLPEPTTVHWHGVDVPNPMDGVPGITQKPVPPDEAFSYEFEARPAGTRWYHTHFQEHRQLDLGLAGPLIIEPAGAEPFAFDREYTLVLDDWATGSGPALRSTAEGTAGASGGMTGMMGRRMMHRGMMSHSHGPAYDTMTINGKAYPATQPLTVRRGERVRLRLINASADHTHVIRLAGHRLRVTHTDGSPLVQAVEVDAIPVAPAERYDAFFVADRPGAWFLTCAAPGHARAGEQVLVVYQGHEKSAAGPVAEGIAGLSLWRYDLGHGMDSLPRPWGQERVFDLALSGGMMGSDFWTINGKRYPETDPLVLDRGDLGRIRFSNMSPEGHPMHLHGQSFRVLAVNGRRLGHPLVKDTVDVAPHMGSATIEFIAHNPGEWFLHCHKPMHMEGGLIALARIHPS